MLLLLHMRSAYMLQRRNTNVGSAHFPRIATSVQDKQDCRLFEAQTYTPIRLHAKEWKNGRTNFSGEVR